MCPQALPLRFRGNAQIEELSFMSHGAENPVAEESRVRDHDPALMIPAQAVPKVALSPGGKVSRTLHDEHGRKIR